MLVEQNQPDREKPVVYAEYVWVDLDRTLVDPQLTMNRFYKAAGRCGAGTNDLEKIRQDRLELESAGGSFDPLQYIKKIDFNDFSEAFLTDRTQILYPDAEPFINQLKKSGIRYNVLTYGVNRQWQGLKLRAGGFNGNGLIIDTPKKLEYFAGRTDKYGNYPIDTNGRVTASNILLIDDKPGAFYGSQDPVLPQNCRGILVNRDPERLKGKAIPHGVGVVSSLSELAIIKGKMVIKNRK